MTDIRKNEIMALKQDSSTLLDKIKAYEVNLSAEDDILNADLVELADLAKQAGRKVKQIKDKFEVWLAPLRFTQKDLNATKADVLAVPDEVKKIAGQKAIEIQKEIRRRIFTENERIRLENEATAKAQSQVNDIAEKTGAEPVLLEKKPEVYVPPKAIGTRKRWDFEVTDPNHEALRALVIYYLAESGKYEKMLDMAIRENIRKAVSLGTIENLQIAGVRIFQDESLVVR